MKLRVPAAAALAAATAATLATLSSPALASASAATAAKPAAKPAVKDAATALRVRPLTGAAVFYSYTDRIGIDRYEPGKGFTRIGTPSDNFEFAASPDGRKVAWITPRGEVKVSQSGRVTTIAKGAVNGGPCLTPTWSPDSRRVAFVNPSKTDASPVTIVNLDGTGRRKAGVTEGVCHLTWSGDGRYLAGYAGSANGVHKLDLQTGKTVKAKGIAYPTHVQSLSPNGRNVIVHMVRRGEPQGDGGWPSQFTPTVVDTVTGKKLPIPVKGRLVGALYLADGRLVVRVAGRTHNDLVVLDATGKRLQTLTEPAKAKNLGLLQVVR
ncbi:PD40 domain-containing protein [Sphaerisporangium siamense]|uniref:WD40 repeat protein n=1 Tax=Sphaerisporangium siamense TaxID=795645 RepID=A0A7W7DEA7_9ACTN|nr:PD40 domain-containing protein [Sphaerisporangium siamense]MBB4705238.1 hypothetical protein [Sphaerisporangium siamense]